MKCIYCNKDAKGTREHIISSCILDLFPECFLTFDSQRKLIYKNDPVIKDVCANCNSKLSYIDSYAKEFISKYFLRKYKIGESLNIDYDLCKLQKIFLKYAFNDARSRKMDVSFFDSAIKEFLLCEENNVPLENVTLLAGLAINITPAPDYVFGNQKLQWSPSPMLLTNSLIENINFETGEFTLRNDLNMEDFNELKLSYIFRFNSLQVILLCWDSSLLFEKLSEYNNLLSEEYPYTKLDKLNSSTLYRCTNTLNYNIINLVECEYAHRMTDFVLSLKLKENPNYFSWIKETEKIWEKDEKLLASRYKRK